MNQLSIVEVIGRYSELKRVGQEWKALCPFHAEKTPSFFVNEKKGVFHCWGCSAGGDVIRFVELIEGVDFKGALSHLGLADQPPVTREEIIRKRRLKLEAATIMAWALNMSDMIGERMREIGQRGYMARKVLGELTGADENLLRGEIESVSRQWEILTAMDNDLDSPARLLELWREKEMIESFVGALR